MRTTRPSLPMRFSLSLVLGLAVGLGAIHGPVLALPPQHGDERDAASAARLLEAELQRVTADTTPSVVEVFSDVGSERPASDARQDGAEGDGRGGVLEEFHHFFFPGAGPRNRAQGSGFLVEPEGTVVTNAHVVGDGSSIRVRLASGQVVGAEVLGKDAGVDVAVLRIPVRGTQALRWGDSSALRPGTMVLAVGSPFGLHNSVTLGIVSGVGRRRGVGSGPDYIQTDAAINSGNSGGPLVNLEGDVVGVNTWILSAGGAPAGLGFAVPSDMVREVVHRFVGPAEGERDAWLGIVPAPATGDGRGLRIYVTFPGSPAEGAGLRSGNRILGLDGEPLDSVAMLRVMLENRAPGQTVSLLMEGREEPVTVTLGSREEVSSHLWSRKGEEAPGSARARRPVTSTSEPLQGTPGQEGVLRSALGQRRCPCPCGRMLFNCFGCSAAKSDLTEAQRLVQEGLTPGLLGMRLDAPVSFLVWADYTDPEGRRVLRVLDGLREAYGPLIRVRRRYFPADPKDLEGWRRSIEVLETARAAGKYEEAHRLLVQEGSSKWAVRLRGVLESLELDPSVLETPLPDLRFRAQMEKDLHAAPQQFGVETSPALFMNGKLLKGKLDAEDLSHRIEKRLEEESL